jgi:hypothetical protein
MTLALEQGRAWLARGFAPIPIPHGRKGPVLEGWTDLRLTEATLAEHFNGIPQNVGALQGAPSDGRVCVDLDSPEAVALAPAFLLPTGLIHGRPGNPRSHWFYRVTGSLPATARLDDPRLRTAPEAQRGKARIAELLSTGTQVVVAGQHPSGEDYRLDEDGPPAEIDGDDLVERVYRLAAAALLARYWPPAGQRHDASLALAGGLLRGGWSVQDAAHFVEAIARAAGDEEARGRARNCASTAARLASEGQATGWPTLLQLVEPRIVEQVRAWLGLRLERPPAHAEAPWPGSLAAEAFHGLAGAIVQAIEPTTESDPAAVLVQLLVAFANAAGRGAYFLVEDDRHYLNEYVAIVGKSAKARKGTSLGRVRRVCGAVDETWEQTRILSGLSSGEGFAYAVRDPQTKMVAVRRDGKATGEYEEQVVDAGVADKRLLVQEAELASVLKVMTREGNILSTSLRDAWDRGTIGTLTKNNPVRATGAHVSVIGHITVEELRRTLEYTEAANGFANRFLWICAQRSKLLPEGGRVDQQVLNPLIQRLHAALTFARTVGEMRRDDEARALWHAIYEALSADQPGLFGAIVARAEAHVMRLACIYALLDESATVRTEHLCAAIAIWDYAEASARHIFGDSTGDPDADTILTGLRANGALDRTDISALFGRNASAARIDRALGLLLQYGLARRDHAETSGRAREVWEPTSGGA